MSTVLMFIIGGIGTGLVIQYLMSSLYYKKRGKDKKQISEGLIELLKE